MAAERSAQREALLHAWTSPGLLEVLEIIADGIRDVAGFDTTAFSLVRDGSELEFLTARSGGQMLYVFGGTFFPIENLQDEWLQADVLGRFMLVPEERRRLPARWHSPPALVTNDQQWRPIDLLFAPLFHANGELMATIMIDSPMTGMRPSPDQLRHLDTFVSHTEQVLRRALEYDALTERIKLIEELHDIVRSADLAVPPFEVFAQVAEPVRIALNATTISAQLWDEGDDEERDKPPPQLRADGTIAEDDPELLRLAVVATRLALQRRTVAVVSEGRIGSPFLPPDHHATALASIRLRGLHSAIQVPLFVGTNNLGSLFLLRSRDQGRWADEEIAAAAEFGLDLGQALVNAREFIRGLEVVDRLREIDAYKTHLISQISHEFRSPLTSIAGHLELTEENGGVPPPPSLAAMRRGTNRLIALTEQLLTLSRAAEKGTDNATCDASEMVTTAVARCADRAHEAGVRIVIGRLDRDARVHGAAYDAELLAVNLLDNAIKYSEPGGTVRIDLDIEDGGLGEPDTVTVLRIADEGIGIAEEDQGRLFEEFFRSEDPAVMNRPGTGLGLSIVARIVADRMRGSVGVESQLGVGTTFIVRVPLAGQ